MKQSFGVIIFAVLIVAAISLFQSGNKPSNSRLETPELTQDQEMKKTNAEITMDVLQALADYYLATVTVAEEDDDFTGIMAALLNQNKYLESGKIHVKAHLNNPNEIIQLTAQGMNLGADMVIKANNELVQFIRKMNLLDDPNAVQEIQFATATYLSNQKEGYKTISISAPQITALLFEPAKTKNPTGKIPYTITKEERERLLKQIERLFGDDLRSYRTDVEAKAEKYNAILFSVNAIHDNLIHETYEEAEKR